MEQYKVVKITSNWSLEKLRQKMEENLNLYARQGWKLVSINMIDSTYTAFITLSK